MRKIGIAICAGALGGLVAGPSTAQDNLGVVSPLALFYAAMATADFQYSYDSAGRLIRVEHANGSITQYGYDAAGNRTVVTTSLGANRQPVAVNDSADALTAGSVDIAVRSNDSDPDGDILTITSVSTVTGGGTVTIEGGGTHVRYTAPATPGVKSFTYTVSDGRGGTSTATVNVNAGQANHAPTANNDSASTETSAAVDILVRSNDIDPDGDTLTITSVSAVTGGGTAVVQGGGSHVRYTAPTTPGVKSFTYTVSDDRGGTSTATVNVNVAQANRAPKANNDSASTVTSAAVDIQVRSNDTDPDGDTLTITSVSAVTGGGTAVVQSSGGHVRYTAPTTPGAKSFTYTVSDSRGGTSTATVNVNVAQANRPPVAVNDSATVVTSRAVGVWVRTNDSDPDGDPMTVTAVSAVSGGGTATIASGGTHVIYTSPATAGAKSFTYTVSDGKGGTASATVNVTVNVAPPNRPPVVYDDSAALEYNDNWDIMVLSNDNDPDGDELTITSITKPLCGTAQISSNSKYITFKAPNQKSTCMFNYTASDGRGGTASTFVRVNVRATGTPPPIDW